MTSFAELKKQANSLFDAAENCTALLSQDYAAKNIRKIKKDLSGKELTVITCGEMRRGKSSLMQAFLEEGALFPVDINTCTNVITIVRYGETEKIEVILEDRNEKGEVSYETILISRSEIDQYVTEYGNENNHKSVNCLNIVIPSEKLKDGFVFVDTPGLGSLNFQHSQVTQSFLPNADLLLFVSDALAPLTDTELSFIRQAYQDCQNIVFILTKTDKVSKDTIDTLISDMKQKVSAAISISEDTVDVIPVSSLHKLKYLKSKKASQLKNSNFENLEKAIWEKIYRNRGAILILPFLVRLKAEILELQQSLKVLTGALEKATAAVDKLKDDLQKKAEKRRTLLEDGAKWKADLQFDMGNLSISQTGVIQDEAHAILEQFQVLLGEKVTKEKLEGIIVEINSALTNLTSTVKNNISHEVSRINTEISRDLGLILEHNDESLKNLRYSSQNEVGYYTQPKSASDQFVSYGRHLAMNSLGAAALTTVIGGVIGGVFGFFTAGPVGAIVGAKAMGAAWTSYGLAGGTAKGLFDGYLDRKNLDLPTVKTAFINYINRSINGIKSSTSISIREITKLMQEDLSEQLKDQIAQLDMLVAQLQKNINLKAADIPARKEKLNSQLQLLSQLEKETETLIQDISAEQA